jgi:hypothetical protein
MRWKNDGSEDWAKADDVLKDWPEEAMVYLWNNHRNDIRVRDWINKSRILKKLEGFVDIETFAQKLNLDGAIACTSLASIRGATTIPGAHSIPGAGSILESTLVCFSFESGG